MKKYLALLLLFSILSLSLSACGDENSTESDTSDSTTVTNDTEAETESEVWSISESIECEEHHRDYHIIPYHLAKHIGIDESNAWADKVKESTVELSEEVKCSCPDFNVKKYIDDLNVSREDFISYGDLVYLGTYDTAVLFEMTPEEIEEYYIYSEELIDKTIQSQHFSFIETHFQYEYSSVVYDTIVYDEEAGIGVMPSIPQLVQTLNISRTAFEQILEDCTEQNIEVYERSYSFDYDLDLIYNEDGSFKELPTFDGLSEYETVMKLNRLFCNRDN